MGVFDLFKKKPEVPADGAGQGEGEGMTDKNFLNLDVRNGQRVIYTKMEFTRDQLLRRGEWRNRVPMTQTKNFRGFSTTQVGDNVIQLPGILAEPKK